MASTILRMENITKLFPGVKALDHVNIDVTEGEIHAIVGENGAGKSTLMNVLSGIYPYGSYTGEVYYQDELCAFKTIKDSERRGIAIIHQELALVPHLSIAENMYLGNEQEKAGVINWDLTNQQAAKYMKVVGLKENPRTLIKDIGMGKQQLVEIAKALAKDVKLLILDEPTSSLNENDVKKLLDLLIEFKNKHGITSILISHKLNEIAYCADRITILRDGKSIETLDKKADEISEPRIIKGMVGREMTNRFPKRQPIPRGDVAFEIRDWTVYHPLYAGKKVVDNVSLKIYHGEVVGLAGLIGAGRTELAMSVFGRSYGKQITGTVLINNKPVRLSNISQAIQHGLAYVTEDRKGNGLITSNSIKHNITLSRIEFVSKRGIIDKDLESIRAGEQKEQLDIKAPTVEQYVENLSGGNQQKVLLGKWIFAKPKILLLDEPTRGVDVGAKYEIYEIINQLASEGKAVLMISSELSELLGMCDRIYVMNESRLIGEFSREEASQEAIMGCILQASKGEISA
jgi:putative multiple sugar transport system ATP-binding protein